MTTPKVSAVILAAGKGSRMKSKIKNKVTLDLGGRPLITHTVNHLKTAGISDIYAVVGFASNSVQDVLGDQIHYAVQKRRLGTAHALKQVLPLLPQTAKLVLTMYGDDSAFYPPETYQKIIQVHTQNSNPITLLTITVTNPTGLGRIIRDANKEIVGIIEEKNATPKEKLITEINTGLFCFNLPFLKTYLSQIKKNPISHEYYLTDIISLCIDNGLRVNSLVWPDASIWHGVNTPEQLNEARVKINQETLLI